MILTFSIATFIIGGFGVDFFSVAAEGCHMRNHVMASEGNVSSLAYVLGFWAAIPIAHAALRALGI